MLDTLTSLPWWGYLLIILGITAGMYHSRQRPCRPRSVSNLSAMSYGYLSAKAVESLNRGSLSESHYHMTRLFVFFAFTLSLAACERADAPPPDPGYDYFPLETGTFREYEVTETRYALAQPAQTRIYQIREVTSPKYTDAGGQGVYLLEHSVREENTWRADSVSSIWRTAERAFRSENGLTFVKIQFPVKEGSRWDGNLYNTLAERFFEVKKVDKPLTLGALTFDQTLTVVQQNDSTLLSLRKSQETYARNIGLIRREQTSVQYCGTPDCIGKGVIDYGFTKSMVLKNYGR